MNRRVTLIIAIVLGVVAVLLLRKYINDLQAQYTKPVTSVAVAKRNLPPGTILTPEMVEFRENWPEEIRPSTSFNERTIELVYNQQLKVAIPVGDPILSGYLVEARPVKPLAEILNEGERAITLEVDELSGIAYMIRPNDHVDILGTFDVRFSELFFGRPVADPAELTNQNAEYSFTYTLLQDVTVLAVENRRAYGDASESAEPESEYSSITVAVTPSEAKLIVFALEKGRLTFALRPAEDTLIEDTEERLEVVDVPNLFKHLVRETQERKRRITVKRGGTN